MLSATATLNLARRRSFRLLTVWRLSLSDCAPSMCSSRVNTPTLGMAAASRHDLRGDSLGGEGLDDIAGLNVGEVANGQTALKAVLNFAGVVLKAPEGFHLARKRHHVIAQHSNLAVALDEAIDHHAAGHVADLA